MPKLVIVESPTKAKTLSKILDNNYDIKASSGHIRDLPKKGLGVDVEHNFEPEYEVPSKSKKTASQLKKASKDAESVVLATDPDREGEAIAWHLQYILSTAKGGKKLKFERVVFHELTKEAVLHAFSEPEKVNVDLVDAQQARRVLDRLVGYKLSPLLWKKVRYGLSAGRVQSVAVRLIVEKERERQEFKTDEYWTIDADFESQKDSKKKITARLEKKNDKKLEIKNDKKAKEIESELDGDTFEIAEIKKSERNKKPNAPFKTSTLQQTMANTTGMSASRTMRAAQKLFEQGLITYHRTDSLSMAPGFVKDVRAFAKKEFGASYLPSKAVPYKTKSKGAQEAHEAVRPTDVKQTPKSAKPAKLEGDEKKVYTMIWKRSVECQLNSAVYDQTSLKIKSGKGYGFKATGSVIKFDGWLAVSKLVGEDANSSGIKELPDFAEGEKFDMDELKSEQHFTKPPARYSDASLIKKLEELGIGRPSTYAPTISTIFKRGYVIREGRYFIPDDVAYVVVDLLVEHFPDVVGYEFTAQMEEKFDEIAEGKKEWVPVIKKFYTPFEKDLKEKDKSLSKRDIITLEEMDEECPDCGKKLVMKLGKYGKFLSCPDYPECKFAKPVVSSIIDENGDAVDEDFGKCTECEDGQFILKQGRFGKFLACSNYPKCKTTKPYMDKIGMKCPNCEEGDVVIKKAKKRTFYGCSRYPDCDYSSWKNPKPKEGEKDDEGAKEGDDKEEKEEKSK